MFFSQIDLENAFLQLPLDVNSKQFVVINTTEGLYRYNYLPFGLRCSPGIFQSFITRVLNGIDNIVVYQDDILVMSPNKEEHRITLSKVLRALQASGIKINVEKCKFFSSSVKYLGYIFTNNTVSPDTDKVEAILQAPAPTNLKQVQAFVGMFNYYSRFIPKFSCIMSPMYELLKRNVRFHWGPEQQRSFIDLKELFKQKVILKCFNPNHSNVLETDASGYGISAILFQRSDCSAPWLPVQCVSRTLNAAERNYSNIEREALSVIFGVEKFRHFLLGSKFIIKNDQKPLQKLLSHNSGVPSSCSSRIQRWCLKLSQYNYEFQYSKGSNNVTSDCLSRLPLPVTVKEYEPYELVCTVNEVDSGLITWEHIKEHTNKDPDLIQLKNFIRNGAPDRITNPTLSKFKSLIPQLSIMKECIMFQSRVFIPEHLRQTVLEHLHENHPGISGMKALARSLIWFPGLDKDIENLVNSCAVCQSVRSRPPQDRHVQWPSPSRAWSRVHIDHFFVDQKTCLIAVDALSKYIEVEVVSTTSVKETIDALRLIFSRNGLCDVLVSDNASCFTADEFNSFLDNNGIKHLTSPPYFPASNGQAERGVRVIKDLLKKYNTGESFKTRLAKVLFHYRCTPHNTTHICPSVALNKRKYVTKKDRLNPHYSYEYKANTPVKNIPQLEVGDNVLALNVREGQKWLKATVTRKVAFNIYDVHVFDLNVIWKRHINQLIHLPVSDKEVASCFDNNNNVPVDLETKVRRSLRNRQPVDRYQCDAI